MCCVIAKALAISISVATYDFNILKSSKNKQTGYTFSDLHLDLQEQLIPVPGLNPHIGIGNDLKLDYDMDAITNSLRNLFSTMPGQRFLIPNYGLNLLKFMFAPVSKEYGDLVGNDIVSSIKQWEPRVQVQNVHVVPLPEQNEYDITMTLFVPIFKQFVSLRGVAGNRGFAPINF